MMGGYPQQQQNGFGGGQRGSGNNNFGGHQGGGYSQGRGGRQPGQSGQGNEAYQTNVFNEPDQYGYDSTFPGATVHYLMYKKRKYLPTYLRRRSVVAWVLASKY